MRKIIIPLILLLFIYFIITIINNKEKIVYIGDFTKVYLKSGENIKIDNKNDIINGKRVKYYQNSSFNKGFLYSEKSAFSNTYNILNKNKCKIIIRNGLVATTRNTEIKIKEVITSNIDEKELDLIANNLKIEISKLSTERVNKYPIDLDGNGKEEIIYQVKYTDNDFDRTDFVLLSNSKYSVFESYSNEKNSALRMNESLYMYIDFFNNDDYNVLIQYSPEYEKPYHYKVFSYKDYKLVEVK